MMDGVRRPSQAHMVVLPGMKVEPESELSDPMNRRGSVFRHLPSPMRGHVVAMIGEFVGTFLFLFFAFSATQVANEAAGPAKAAALRSGDEELASAPNPATLLYISLAFGFSLAVNVWIFFRISGGLFNPAVALALCLVGAISWIRGVIVVIAQILGAIAAAAVVSGLFPGALAVRTSLAPNTSVVRGLFIEMFLTAELAFTIFMLAAEKHKSTYLAPVGIGLALFISELSGVQFTGGSLNPARSFGPDVVLGTFDNYHWIYWIGPFLGSLLAVLFYRLVKFLEYETANPGADDAGADPHTLPPASGSAPTSSHSRHPIVGAGQGPEDNTHNPFAAENNGVRNAKHDEEMGYGPKTTRT